VNILLLGTTGQVGYEVKRLLQNSSHNLMAVDRQTIDLANPATIEAAVVARQPDVIINAAAYTAVDQAETEVALSQTINGVAPGYLAAAAAKVGARLIHLSTDYVFDGNQSSPYSESYEPSPLGIYGQSKLVGERAIAAKGDRYVILRTAWVYGSFGHGNFVKTMLRLGVERSRVRVVYDQIGSPTWSQDIATVILQFVERREKCPCGIYHFTNSGVASWYDFAIAIFEEAETLGYPLQIKNVVPITTPEYPTPALRPAYSVLATEKITDCLGQRPPHWRQSLRQMLAEYIPMVMANGA
jgi:dTDP-4-dehydrorhamnose reductase